LATELDAYFICATPRTGSSLLCGLLASTGVAGRPESYFRSEDEAMWASRWGVANSSGTFKYTDFVHHALVEGRSENGVFAARVMWGTLGEMVEKLAPILASERDVADIDVLHRAFGRIRFIYLFREDVLAQAVSWSRAEQTNVWYETIDGGDAPAEAHARFDRTEIDELLSLIEEQNRAWQDWFGAADIRPYEVRYEVLERDPRITTCGVLDYLGLELAPGRAIEIRHRRLADRVNMEWIARYRTST
jgi:trehalose 2-sulfotransferase